MRRPPVKAKRDANEPIIFDALRAFGLSVYPMDLPMDALVGYGGRTFLVEVKTEAGKLTDTQKRFLETWKGDHVILRTAKAAEDWARKVRKGEA